MSAYFINIFKHYFIAPASSASFDDVPKRRSQLDRLSKGREEFRPERFIATGSTMRCQHFYKDRICPVGSGKECPSPHEFRTFQEQPIQQTSNDWKTVHDIYKHVFGVPLDKQERDFKIKEEEELNGTKYYTCLFECPRYGVLYYGEECGSNGAAFDGGLYWYDSRRDAKKAAASVALSHFRAQGHEEKLFEHLNKKKRYSKRESQLPMLDSPYWMERGVQRCRSFNDGRGKCPRNINCTFMHVHEVSNDDPLKRKEVTHSDFEAVRNACRLNIFTELTEQHFSFVAKEADGRKFYTAALRLPNENVIYYSKFNKGLCSPQHVWWYKRKEQAKLAAVGVAQNAFILRKYKFH